LFVCSRATRATLAESRCPELLAQYCDVLLRKGTSTHKKYSPEEIETKIKDVVRKITRTRNSEDRFRLFYLAIIIKICRK
jgi:cullin-5